MVSEIVSDLNRHLLAKLFRFVAPKSIAETGLPDGDGQRGAGEQTVRTDQDNGLILSEPVPEADLKAFRAASAARWSDSASRPVPAT